MVVFGKKLKSKDMVEFNTIFLKILEIDTVSPSKKIKTSVCKIKPYTLFFTLLKFIGTLLVKYSNIQLHHKTNKRKSPNDGFIEDPEYRDGSNSFVLLYRNEGV